MTTNIQTSTSTWIHLELDLARLQQTRQLRRFFTQEQRAQFEWSFTLRIIRMTVFWPVCMQISIILIAQFKWWSGGVFQWRISQLMQRNRRMNALTSILWFGRRSYVTSWPLPPINRTFFNRNEIVISMSEEHGNKPCFFSPLWNAKP